LTAAEISLLHRPKAARRYNQLTQQYQDSLTDENLTLYYNTLVDGRLLQNDLNYKLKVPKRITKTIEVPKPYPQPVSGLFLTAGAGSDFKGRTSMTLGLDFVHRKGWSLGYDYNVLQGVHRVRFGVRVVGKLK